MKPNLRAEGVQMENIGDWKEVNEQARTYVFASGEVRIEGVARVCVRASGTHRIETNDGTKYIVPSGWLAIRLEVDKWTF